MKKIQEGLAIIEVPEESKISRKLEVFYNPAMKLNRDICVLFLNSIENKEMQIADIMAGTGVRAIRFIKELKKGKIKKIAINDHSSIQKIKNNFKLNKIKINSKSNIELSSEDANEFLLKSTGFDYIDIDPFGTPNAFLDSSIKRLARNGILAVTATDTAALCGTYPSTELRNYWSYNYRNGFMHESALRILARKVQLIGAQYDKAMIPILSYSKEHYVRVFFRCIKSRKEADKVMQQQRYINYNAKTLNYEISNKNFKENHITIGPLFAGSLNDKNLVSKMLKEAKKSNKSEFKDAQKTLSLIHDELDIVGSYDLHDLCKRLKKGVPNFEELIKKSNASRTHYNPMAIKTKLTAKELAILLQK